jgi:hypothetical protein
MGETAGAKWALGAAIGGFSLRFERLRVVAVLPVSPFFLERPKKT